MAGAPWRPVKSRPQRPSRLDQCIVLALLLHVWLVVLVGSTPPGTARPGDGIGGSLSVRLQGPSSVGALEGPAAPLVERGPLGDAKTQRSGGSVRQPSATPTPPQPGAAKLGNWNQTPNAAAELSSDAPVEAPPITRSLALPDDVKAIQRPPAAIERSQRSEALDSPTALPAPPLPVLQPALPKLEPMPALTPLPELSRPSIAPAEAAAKPVAEPIAEPMPPLPPAPTPAQAAKAEFPAQNAPAAVPAPQPLAGRPLGGSPDAGSRLGYDVATPPSASASAPLNLNLPLARGGPLSSRGSSGVLQVMPRPPELKSKVDAAIDKAAKADCRKAYSEMGLLAAVPLALDAARDKGCRW